MHYTTSFTSIETYTHEYNVSKLTHRGTRAVVEAPAGRLDRQLRQLGPHALEAAVPRWQQ
jgi:hypothetical protein